MAVPGQINRRRGGKGGARKDLAIAVEGIRPLLKALRHTEDRLDKNLKDRLKEIAKPVRDRASRNAPKGPTGNLKRSLKIGAAQRGVSVYSNLVYAPVVEYGWSGTNKNGYLARAVRDSQRDVEKAADQLFQDIADDFAR